MISYDDDKHLPLLYSHKLQRGDRPQKLVATLLIVSSSYNFATFRINYTKWLNSLSYWLIEALNDNVGFATKPTS